MNMPLLNFLQQMSRAILPAQCLLCLAATGRPLELCHDCEADLPWLEQPACRVCAMPAPKASRPGYLCPRCSRKPPPFSTTTAPLAYDFPINKMVGEFKDKGRLGFGTVLAQLLARALVQRIQVEPEMMPPDTMLVPVPLAKARQRQRGFNQAEEIARQLALALQLPVTNLLLRPRAATPQRQLGADQRQVGVKGSFALNDKIINRIKPSTVILVDDVMTTGATLTEASQLLGRAGVKQVHVAILARTLLEQPV